MIPIRDNQSVNIPAQIGQEIAHERQPPSKTGAISTDDLVQQVKHVNLKEVPKASISSYEGFDFELEEFTEKIVENFHESEEELFGSTIEDIHDSKFAEKISADDLNVIRETFDPIMGPLGDQLTSLKEPTFFSAKEYGLPYSVVFVPGEEADSGIHVLLKTKTGNQEIARGAANVVTLSLHLQEDGYNVEASRSAKKEDLMPEEAHINQIIHQSGKETLVAGIPVNYKGDWSPRSIPKDSLKRLQHKEKDIEKVLFLLPLIKGNDLSKSMHGLEKYEIISIGGKLADCLVDLHQLGIGHRDLKPANILLTEEDDVRLCDFGASTQFGTDIEIGTIAYNAPEVTRDKDLKNNPALDMWSFGMILSEMLYGDQFEILCRPSIDDELMYDFYTSDLFNKNGAVDDLIKQCLSLDPSKRPTAQQASDILLEM